jgi:hypothetical protein
MHNAIVRDAILIAVERLIAVESGPVTMNKAKRAANAVVHRQTISKKIQFRREPM